MFNHCIAFTIGIHMDSIDFCVMCEYVYSLSCKRNIQCLLYSINTERETHKLSNLILLSM